MKKITIALAGNPNVGKSTVFNGLTGMKQHTGNWPGKTVAVASGQMKRGDVLLDLVDLPGAYSLDSTSPDEALTGEYIRSGKPDIVLIVADATCLKRNLILVKDVLSVTDNAVLCVNLMDEAEKKGIKPDTDKLAELLGIPVVGTSARSKQGFDRLLDVLCGFQSTDEAAPSFKEDEPAACNMEPVSENSKKTEADIDITDTDSNRNIDIDEIYARCVSVKAENPHSFDRKLDKIVTSSFFGFPIMILLLMVIFWLTMIGANYPSEALSFVFKSLGTYLRLGLETAGVGSGLVSMLMDGLYGTLTWVISIMLPPMAIFFPLFTLLEDFGYLPRVAFNLDNTFKRCGAHGKQALTMCMGFGCNACGVTGCRIIDSPRERLVAIITNNFVPCNGRFPTLIAMISIFFISGTAAFATLQAGCILAFVIICGIAATLLISKLLSKTVLKGMPSSFVLELPPYRRPKICSVIVRSVMDRTLFVLGRAVAVAAPFGIIIWIFANIKVGNASILNHLIDFMEPFGQIIGVDGVIITAFILGFPANEIVIPIMLMCYMSANTLTDYGSLAQLHEILVGCGWNMQTAMSVVILCLFHFPCGTTCLTIKKETGSLKWTAAAFLLPTATGVLLCFILNVFYTVLM